MNARFALLAVGAPALLLVLHCGSNPKRAEPPPAADEPREAGLDATDGAAGAAAEGETEKAPPRPDPQLVKKVLDRTGEAVPNESESLGLRFEVTELGPGAPWAMAVVNRGNEPLLVDFDPRLLTLEVEPPPPDPKAKKSWKKPKTRSCRLPDELRPSRVTASLVVRLEPGQGIVEAFDPRLYCLPEQGVSPLVPGARVSARFGWPPKTKVVWKAGKKKEQPLLQVEPFVAELAPPLEPVDAEGGADGGADGGVEAPVDAGEISVEPSDAGAARPAHGSEAELSDAEIDGVKELHGTPFELGADYAPAAPAAPDSLALELKSGSDASSESTATATLSVVNRTGKPQRLYFRREFVTFEVSGADGVLTCNPQPDGQAPDRQAFTLLAPGGSLTVTSRLVELCPDDTFARPGLYVIRAQLDTFASGSEFGYDAFVGRLVSPRPVVVRIRTGSLPFPGPRVLEEVRVGAVPPG